MKKNFAIILKIIISVILLVLLVKFSGLDIKETIAQIKNTKIKWFVATCVMFMITMVTNTIRWRILVNLLDYKLSLGKALKLYFESGFANNFLPTNFGGDALRSYDLGRETKTWLKAASTVLMERLFGFSMMFALMPLGILIMKFTSFNGVLDPKIENGLLLSFVVMVLGFLSYNLWSRINLGIIHKINYAFQEYTKCKKSLIQVAFWTFITHMFLLLGNACSALAMGVGIDQIPLWYWLIITPAATLATFVIPAVKGAGAKEASYVYFLGLIGISSSQSFALAFIAFVATLIATLPGISIASRILSISKLAEEEIPSSHCEEPEAATKQSSTKV